jgi:hypothetical protein
MNLFYLHEDPEIAAAMLYRDHRNIQALEIIQMLGNAFAHKTGRSFEYLKEQKIHCAEYHTKHPTVKWVVEYTPGTWWATRMLQSINTTTKIRDMRRDIIDLCIKYKVYHIDGHEQSKYARPLYPPPFVHRKSDTKLPEDPNNHNDVVRAYRDYYITAKFHVKKPLEELHPILGNHIREYYHNYAQQNATN